MDDDIAVIGLGVRFPGSANSPENLWKVLENGESQWSEIPKNRMDIDGFFHPSGDRLGSISFRGGHFLKGDFAAFDAPFFSIAAEDAKAIDPQQRMLLEVSYEALENAGIRKEDIDGSDTAVYVGSFVKDYEQICLRDPDWAPQYAATGNGIAIMANRISYFFNLHGPSVTIDTGCSGSLVSIHLAAQSIRNGESSLAIAAGAGMILTPNTIMPMTALNFLSPDGKCFTFDSRANGYGRGEGIGVVVLKRLSEALRDNDPIRAVIRGSKVNQDGRTTGITLPSKEAQVANIRSVYASTGLDFSQTAYVECHGTGTQAGDWRELKAISETLGSVRPKDQPIIVGSVKPNIGHLEGAAGVAGLIKGVLILEHGRIPPNINYEKGNPNIHFEEWGVKVPQEMLSWPIQGTKRISVNCFGFGGTNAHVILDEAPQGQCNASQEENSLIPQPQLYLFSSHERQGVSRVTQSHIPYLDQKVSDSAFPDNYAYTLACRRSNQEWRLPVVANSITELLEQIRSIEQSSVIRAANKDKRPRVCFVFAGQGAQWAAMGKDLLVYEVFQNSLEDATKHMLARCSSPFNLLEEVMRDDMFSTVNDPAIAQPATTALQVALVDLLHSFGVTCSQVVGHSSGEIAAAYAAGAISREDAWQIAYYRGLTAASLKLHDLDGTGGMMVVGMAEADVGKYLAELQSEAEIACINSFRSTTISGPREAINAIAADLRLKKTFCRILAVSIAYHSKQMLAAEADYKRSIKHIVPRDLSDGITMFSTVTGNSIQGTELTAEYWARNLVSPVQYLQGINSMMVLSPDQRPDIIIELSPTASLKSPTSDIVDTFQLNPPPKYLSVLDRRIDGASTLLGVMGTLWACGLPIKMQAVMDKGHTGTYLKTVTDLPPYPWNHDKPYWFESHLGVALRFRKYPRMDLIGAPTIDSHHIEPRWRGFLRVSESPWIQDHQVQKTVIYPAAGMVAMVIEGAAQLWPDKTLVTGYEVSDMHIEKAMLVPNSLHGLEFQLNMRATGSTIADRDQPGIAFTFSIHSKQLDKSWECHAHGHLKAYLTSQHDQRAAESVTTICNELKKSSNISMLPRQLYELLDTMGMNYGPSFQNVVDIKKGDDGCVSTVRVPDTLSKMPSKYEYPHIIHPATLDAMFHTLFAIEATPMVPTYIKKLFVSSDIVGGQPDVFSGYSTARRVGLRGAEASIGMALKGHPSSVVTIEGLQLTSLATPGDGQGPGGFIPNYQNLVTELIWKEDVTFVKGSTLVDQIAMAAHKFPGLAIMQVGGGIPVARAILKAVFPDASKIPHLSRYTIARKGDDEEELAQMSTLWVDSNVEPFAEFKSIDGTEALAEYHMIIVSDGFNIKAETLTKHLFKGGLLLKPSSSVTNGDIGTEHKVTFCDESSKINANFVIRSNPAALKPKTEVEVVLWVPAEQDNNKDLRRLTSSLSQYLTGSGGGFIVSIITSESMSSESTQVRGKIVINLLDFAGAEGSHNASIYHWSQNDFDTFHRVHESAKGMLWLTRGAFMTPVNPKGAPAIGLIRTLLSEDPTKTIAMLDLDIETCLGATYVPSRVTEILKYVFLTTGDVGPRELEFAEKDGNIFIPRLDTVDPLNSLVYNGGKQNATVEEPFLPTEEEPDYVLELSLAQPSLALTNLTYVKTAVSEIGPFDVEIAFDSAPLTYLDVDIVTGKSVRTNVGLDVHGRIVRAGLKVPGEYLTGDIFSALVPGGAIRSLTRVDYRLARRFKVGLHMSSMLSAIYGLDHVGLLSASRSVLVHAGTSFYGVAAVQVALQLKPRALFVTTFDDKDGSQRVLLEQMGVEPDNIIDEINEDVAAVLKKRTSGQGVNVIYNSTALLKDVDAAVISKFGTIIQFADQNLKPSNAPNYGASVSVLNFDLSAMLTQDPESIYHLLSQLDNFLEEGDMDLSGAVELDMPEPLDNIATALDNISSAPYHGIHSITAGHHKEPIKVPVVTESIKPLTEAIDPDGIYVLAGGLGGLGRDIAEQLVSNGARHLVFMSRSGNASGGAVIEFLESLAFRGVAYEVFKVDICDSKALNKIVTTELAELGLPIRGVFQCAAVIMDGMFENMTFADWKLAFEPKAQGSWNLAQSFDNISGDPFFVFLASSAGIVGNRGQANYAAGNCFEDALARKLHLEGKQAVSIDLGPVLGAGMLAEDEDLLSILKASGFYGIRHSDFQLMIKHAITGEILPGIPMPPQITLGVGTGGLMAQNQPADAYWERTALYTYLAIMDRPDPDLAVGSSAIGRADVKNMLASCATLQSAINIITVGLVSVLSKAMSMLPEEIDICKPPNAYGVDSLVAVGIRNWIFSNCAVSISVFEVLSDDTVAELAEKIAEKGRFGDREE